MLLKHYILLFLVSSVHAQIIEVSSLKTNFKLDLSNSKKISIKGHQISLSIIQKDCNQKIIQDFVNKTKKLIKTRPLKVNAEKGLFIIKINNEIFYENPKSKVGFNFLSIPREFQRIKIQEKTLCNK